MSSEIAISVEHVSKAYRLWDNPSARITVPLMETAARMAPPMPGLKASLQSRASRLYRDFWALDKISFSVKRGESLAIIGRNGSGKSTLLQIIAGTLQPTTGSANVRGRVAALLELGSGFNPEFTGRENIHLNASLFGLSRSEIDAKFSDIVAFADIGDFIEQPVKIYSSGMVVRLAFAVAAHIAPDILIVDEALSVGDARFQLKCARAIDRFLAQGVTLLFVSHDTSMVKRLCKQAILLEAGKLIYGGHPNDVVNLYSKLIAEGGTVASLAPDLAALQGKPSSEISLSPPGQIGEDHNPSPQTRTLPTSTETLHLKVKAMETILSAHPENKVLSQRVAALLEDERLHVQVSGKEFSYGGNNGRILKATMIDAEGQERTWFSTCEPVAVRMTVETDEDIPDPIFALTIKNVAGVEIYGTNTFYGKQPASPLKRGAVREVNFAFNLYLMPGHYFISLGFTYFVGNELVVVHRRYDTIKFEIHGTDHTFGIANLQAKITTRQLSVSGSV